jgi:flagellar basal-body rod protein FlgB
MTDPIFNSSSMQLAQKFLDAAALRQNAIASNLANLETPGYRRVDVSTTFESQLKASLESGTLDPAAASAITPSIEQDQLARSIRPDGNNVDVDKELLAMDKNTTNYNFLSDVVTHNIKQLKLAISGN